jgi:DNA-binding SARP family transcriptional activator
VPLASVRNRCYNGEVEFGVLGPLRVADGDREIPLHRQKHRALLAYLVLNAGEVVSVDRLIDELWGEQPPATAKNSLRNCVWQLRKLLGAHVLRTRGPGYLIDVDADAVDVRRFVGLLEDARAQAAPARAATLRRALSLWRGPALADVEFEPFALVEASRLEELRVAAEEELVAAELDLGRHAELLSRIEELVGRNPLRERLRAQLMLALYRSGRQADALAAFREARRTLVEELGIEPGPTLRALEQAILRHDPALPACEIPFSPPSRPADLRERRATVTVLYAEVTSSDDSDAERYRALTTRAFHEMRSATEYHGGTIERLAGDELIAVFGVPERHEDDALRAVRAALQIRRATRATPQLPVRLALATGEVVAPGPAVRTPVAGAPVIRAKRLAEAAPPGEIVASASTVELVRDLVLLEPLAPLRVRGRDQPVDAARIEGVHETGRRAPTSQTPLVGREKELQMLAGAFADVATNGRSAVLTLLGDAGVGKTRLAIELAASLEPDARVVVGRCVAYGEDVTWLPLRGIVRLIDVPALLEEKAAGTLAALLGGGTVSTADSFWAARRLFAALAGERPALIVLEDLHWAAPTFLDFVEQLVAVPADAPALVLALARPELADERPHIPALRLQPLSDQDARALVDAAAHEALPAEACTRIAEVAEGNPLFAEQLLAYALEHGIESLGSVPPTVEALLASRIDRVDAEERATLQRAAVVGREFWQASVLHLTPALEAPAVGRHLGELARRDLIGAARSSSEREDAFRFRHALIRDVAYASIPKLERAELHEGVADWLDTQNDADDEIVGYHLEQAHEQRSQVGAIDDHARRLASAAGARLEAAGIRASKRADSHAAASLLARAVALLPARDPRRLELTCELAIVERAVGEADRACERLAEVVSAAAEIHDRRLELRARLELMNIRLHTDGGSNGDEFLELARAAIPVFEESRDERALARAWLLTGDVRGAMHGEMAAWAEAAERAQEHYERARWPSSICRPKIAAALYHGPVDAPTAIRRCHQLAAQAGSDRFSEAGVLVFLGGLVAMRGRFAQARELLAKARAIYEELPGVAGFTVVCDEIRAQAEILAGSYDEAEQLLRASCDFHELRGERALFATQAGTLAEVLYVRGRFAEAGELCRRAAQRAAADDFSAQVLWRSVSAKIAARNGNGAEAEALAREAVDVARHTDALNRQGRAVLDLAQVVSLDDRPGEAAAHVERAVELFERKGNSVAMRKARKLLKLTPH